VKWAKTPAAPQVIAAHAELDVTSATAELGKEEPRGRRMVREAVQDERRLTIGITTLQRVEGAVWQVEGDVFEVHVCQASPRAVGREMLMLASVSLVLDMCVSSGTGCTAGVSRPVGFP
jgi:hypothetical protein